MSYGPNKTTLKLRELMSRGATELEATREVLTPKQLKACHARAGGASLKDCVKASMDPKTFGQLGKSPKFTSGLTEDKVFNGIQIRYLELLREKAEKEALMSMTERRKFLADVVRTPIGKLDENSPLVQMWEERDLKEGGTAVRKSMPNKLQAVQMDAELAGELVNQGTDPQINIALLLGRLPDTSRVPAALAAPGNNTVNVTLTATGKTPEAALRGSEENPIDVEADACGDGEGSGDSVMVEELI